MAQQVRQREQKIISYDASNKVSEDLSRGMIYRELNLRLKGQLTVAAANNTAAKTLRGDEWAVVKKIEIIANNQDTIKSISGNALWWLNYFLYGTYPQVTPTIGDGATLNPSFDTVLTLPFWMPRSIRPIDTALDARVLSDLKIEVTWGTHLDINADATGFTSGPSLQVDSLESFNVTGPFSKWRVYPIEKEITATNSEFQINLPVGPMYRGFLLNFTDADVDSAAILNTFRWKSGTTTFADIDAPVLYQREMIRRGLQYAAADPRRGNANVQGGWYMYDHVADGMLTESVDALGLSEIELKLDVTVGGGTTKVYVWPMEILPVRGKTNA